jgi:hypothetical protein
MILDALEACGPYYLSALAEGDMGSRYKSLHRAMLRLEEAGRIQVVMWHNRAPKLAVAAIGSNEMYEGPGLGGLCLKNSLDREDVAANTARVAEWARSRN